MRRYPHRVVLDTNVVFEGLTRQGGACGLIIDAWSAGLIRVCVSDALAYEYVDVLSRKLTPARWAKAKRVVASLLSSAEFVFVYYTWRPSSPDAGDDLVIDCAMNADAALVTANIKDFRRAQAELGLRIMTPVELIKLPAK